MKKENDLNKELLEYENLEKQLEVVLIQKHQLQLQLNEIKHAMEELKKTHGEVYRSTGAIMIKSNREEADKDLKDRKELIEMRLSGLVKSEEKMRVTVVEAQKSLQQRMKDYGQGSS